MFHLCLKVVVMTCGSFCSNLGSEDLCFKLFPLDTTDLESCSSEGCLLVAHKYCWVTLELVLEHKQRSIADFCSDSSTCNKVSRFQCIFHAPCLCSPDGNALPLLHMYVSETIDAQQKVIVLRSPFC